MESHVLMIAYTRVQISMPIHVIRRKMDIIKRWISASIAVHTSSAYQIEKFHSFVKVAKLSMETSVSRSDMWISDV
jgi:hypothetical protein